MADLSSFINIGANTANFVGEVSSTSNISTTGNVNVGNVVLTQGGTIGEVPSPVSGNYAVAISALGAVSPDQQLLVYPTNIDANHLHLTSGNLLNTELYLGNDDLYVKLANTGNVQISTFDPVTSLAGGVWEFGNDSNLTLPGSLISNNASPQPVLQGFEFNNYNGNIAAQGNAFSITANTHPSFDTGYNISLSGGLGNVSNGNVNITTANTYGWAFGNDGSTTFGSGSRLTGDPASFTLNPTYTEVIDLRDNTTTGFYTNSGQYIIQANSTYSWSFDATGNLQTPAQPDTEIQSTGNDTNSISLAWRAAGNIAASRFTANYLGAYISANNGTDPEYQWQFGPTGNLTLPGNTFAVNYANGTPVTLGGIPSQIANGTSNVTIATANADVTVNVGEAVSTFDSTGNLVLSNNFVVGAPGGIAQISAPNALTVSTSNGTQAWTFGTAGNLQLPVTNVNAPAGESTQFVGTRKIVNGAITGATAPYAVELAAGGTPTVAYTSTAGVQSTKVTFVTQASGAGFQWEQFDVVATPSGDSVGDVNYVVTNRIKSSSAIADTVVTATMNGTNQIEISLNLDASQTNGGTASFDATEFGLMVD